MFRSHNRLIKNFLGNFNKLSNHGWTEADCERKGSEPSIFAAEIHATEIFTLLVKIGLTLWSPKIFAATTDLS